MKTFLKIQHFFKNFMRFSLKQLIRTKKGHVSRFFRASIAFLVIAMQIVPSFLSIQEAFAAEVGHNVSTASTLAAVTDSKTSINLDKSLETGVAGSLKSANPNNLNGNQTAGSGTNAKTAALTNTFVPGKSAITVD